MMREQGFGAVDSASEIRKRVALRLSRTAASAGQREAAKRARVTGNWAEHEEVSAAADEYGLKIKVWEGHRRPKKPSIVHRSFRT